MVETQVEKEVKKPAPKYAGDSDFNEHGFPKEIKRKNPAPKYRGTGNLNEHGF